MNGWIIVLDTSLDAGIYYLITYILGKTNNKQLYNISDGNKCYEEKYSIEWTVKVVAALLWPSYTETE